MDCPCCGKKIKPAEEVLSLAGSLYMACRDCPLEPNLDKNVPYSGLKPRVQRCSSCKKAPLDLVMFEALGILIEEGLRDESANLRSVGWPMVEIGYPLAYPPRLGENELIIVGEGLDRTAAKRLVKIPEIKGVILGGGVPGVSDLNKKAHRWELLRGCDLRCDVVQSLLGELVIYKNQSQIHVEFSKENAPKMKILENLYFQGRLEDVADCMCGPGTLGLMAALEGAKRVVLNDVWLPAIKNVMINLEANRTLLGIEEIEHFGFSDEGKDVGEDVDVGTEPKLVGLASGVCEFEVYHGDAKRLFEKARPSGLCLIDPFPGMETNDLIEACGVCNKVVII